MKKTEFMSIIENYTYVQFQRALFKAVKVTRQMRFAAKDGWFNQDAQYRIVLNILWYRASREAAANKCIADGYADSVYPKKINLQRIYRNTLEYLQKEVTK